VLSVCIGNVMYELKESIHMDIMSAKYTESVHCTFLKGPTENTNTMLKEKKRNTYYLLLVCLVIVNNKDPPINMTRL